MKEFETMQKISKDSIHIHDAGTGLQSCPVERFFFCFINPDELSEERLR